MIIISMLQYVYVAIKALVKRGAKLNELLKSEL